MLLTNSSEWLKLLELARIAKSCSKRRRLLGSGQTYSLGYVTLHQAPPSITLFVRWPFSATLFIRKRPNSTKKALFYDVQQLYLPRSSLGQLYQFSAVRNISSVPGQLIASSKWRLEQQIVKWNSLSWPRRRKSDFRVLFAL